MKYLLLLMSLFILSCTSNDWSGTVRYEVTGSTTDASIIYDDDGHGDGIVASTTLPWSSGNIRVNAQDDSPFHAYVKATNTTSNNTTLEVYIYIDGELKAQNNSSGPNCSTIAKYTVEVN
jgi:hypothetical protein